MSLIIAQREDPRPGTPKRKLELKGSLSPVFTLDFGGEQRAEVEWNPGSTRATVLLDGPSEDPTIVSFRWRSRLFKPGQALLDDRPINTLLEVVQAMDSFRRDTALVDVEWDGTTYTGVFRKFSCSYGLRGVYDAQATFEWVVVPSATWQGWGIPEPAVIAPRSFAAQLQANFDKAMGKARKLVTFLRKPVEAVELSTGRVRANIAQVASTAESLRNVQQDAFGVARQMATGIQELGLTTAAVWSACKYTPSVVAQTDDALMQIRAATWLAHIGRAVRGVRTTSGLQSAAYRADEDLLGWHHVVSGDTLFSISVYWYGYAVYARAIKRRNNLHSTTLRPGQRLRIPRIAGVPGVPHAQTF